VNIDDVRRQIIIDGKVFDLVTDDYKDAQVIHEIWCQRIYAGLELNENDVVLDLGAHVGAFTVWALKIGVTRLIAVEPFPPNVRSIQRNVLPHWSNLIFYNAAVARENGTAELIINARANTHSNTTHPLRRAPSARSMSIDVPAISLTYLLEHFRPTKIKCDCEGIESLIFADPLPDLSSIQRMIVEYHFNYPGMLESVQKSIVALVNAGFTVHTEHVPDKMSGWPQTKLFTRSTA
jgi:FkbM family methyltransferase